MFKTPLIVIGLLSTTLFAKGIVYDFEKTSLAKWQTYGTWNITQEAQEHILSMQKRSQGGFNLCYSKDISFLNGTVSVKFRANTGKIDQGGGIMWRAQDNDNYYVARFNPLEDNFRFYIVKDGYRKELASAEVKLSKGWHTMRIEQKDAHFIGYLDDKKYLEYTDKTLTKSGDVGVWTKADAHTSFDNINIKSEK